jgi:thymidine phosphorylase
MKETKINRLKVIRLGIDTRNEHVIFMRQDCHLCRSEGFESLTRVRVSRNGHSIVATLDVVTSELLTPEEISLSDSACEALEVKDNDYVEISHLSPIDSLSLVRAKIYGKELSLEDYTTIMNDIVQGNYSEIHITGFVTACAGRDMKLNEIVSLTKAMISVGSQINWNAPMVMDKHCIGGVPANRTTPIVVSIAAACGLIIPKTSSRAITSPAGTADVLDIFTNASLSLEKMHEVVDKENACMCWGGSVDLSPADDILIRVEKALDIDSEAQVIASVLSKKKAAGSTHVLIDIPCGATAKVRSMEDAIQLARLFEETGKEIGLHVKVLITDGAQPVGNGIGPLLEARDVLAVLKNEADAPQDLKEKSLQLAAALLELSGKSKGEDAVNTVKAILESGIAYQKFAAICKAQGRYSEPSGFAPYKQDVLATAEGVVEAVDNRRLAKVAKLAGGPNDPEAGIVFHAHINKRVAVGDVLFTIYANTPGQLSYALEYVARQKNIIMIKECNAY